MKSSVKRKFYIAGPMTGMPGLNFEAFDEAQKHLESQGFNVVNPAESGRKWLADHGGRQPNEVEYEAIMRDCFDAIRKCDAIYLLKGWETSPGAKREASFALIKGLKVEVQR